jgi:hypothetical protein
VSVRVFVCVCSCVRMYHMHACVCVDIHARTQNNTISSTFLGDPTISSLLFAYIRPTHTPLYVDDCVCMLMCVCVCSGVYGGDNVWHFQHPTHSLWRVVCYYHIRGI